jgi:hypothetical protein
MDTTGNPQSKHKHKNGGFQARQPEGRNERSGNKSPSQIESERRSKGARKSGRDEPRATAT